MRGRKAGFTGTREELTVQQVNALAEITDLLEPAELHHGDCVGSDAKMHDITRTVTGARIIIHPPLNPRFQAFCMGAAESRPTKPYLDRNKDIVDETDYLIATPRGRLQELRSGAWSTVRYARSLGRPIVFVYPDGVVEIERID